MKRYELAIVGAGPGGLEAAAAAMARGLDAVVGHALDLALPMRLTRT